VPDHVFAGKEEEDAGKITNHKTTFCECEGAIGKYVIS